MAAADRMLAQPENPGPKHELRGRDVLLATLGQRVCGIAEVAKLSDPGVSPPVLRLNAAVVLAGLGGDIDVVDELLDARKQLVSGDGTPAASLGKWLGKRLERTGKRLAATLVPEGHPLLDGPFHRALMAINGRLCDRIAVDLVADRLVRKRLTAHIANARTTRVALLEIVIGLVWADKRTTSSEVRLVGALIELACFEPTERAALRRTLADGTVTLDRIAIDVADPLDRIRLLETLALAAFIDGHFGADEKAYIDRVAAAFELTPQDSQAIDLRVAEQLANDPRLLDMLRTDKRIARTFRTQHGTIDRLVRRNLKAIREELWQTGDLMALLARSMREPLTADEQRRMREQLIDVCKAVPALALFAAPGGTLLLPILAKVLPFSLAPSSFQDPEETVY